MAVLTIAPEAIVTVGQTLQLAAAGGPVTWSVPAGTTAGTVSLDGLYTPPAATGSYVVRAASVADPTVYVEQSITVVAAAVTLPENCLIDSVNALRDFLTRSRVTLLGGQDQGQLSDATLGDLAVRVTALIEGEVGRWPLKAPSAARVYTLPGGDRRERQGMIQTIVNLPVTMVAESYLTDTINLFEAELWPLVSIDSLVIAGVEVPARGADTADAAGWYAYPQDKLLGILRLVGYRRDPLRDVVLTGRVGYLAQDDADELSAAGTITGQEWSRHQAALAELRHCAYRYCAHLMQQWLPGATNTNTFGMGVSWDNSYVCRDVRTILSRYRRVAA